MRRQSRTSQRRRTRETHCPFDGLDSSDPTAVGSERARTGATVLLVAASFLLFSGQAREQTLAKAQPYDPAEFFEKNISPVLVSRCYTCHSNLQRDGLRLDSTR